MAAMSWARYWFNKKHSTLVSFEDLAVILEKKARLWLNSKGYVCWCCDGKIGLLHRLLIAASKEETVDHVNRVKTDNRRSNLRIATSRQNKWNTAAYGASGFKGVYKIKKTGTWMAMISNGGGATYLGCFKTAEAAARRWDEECKKTRGEFAVLNFPEF